MKKRIRMILEHRKQLEDLETEFLIEKIQNIKNINNQNSSLWSQRTEDKVIAFIVEIIRRQIGIIPYWTQIYAALQMTKDNIVEMATGEGKTVTAIIAMSLLVLKDRKVILFTQNEYLATRDYEYSKKFFNILDITTATIKPISETIDSNEAYKMEIQSRQQSYNAQIIYTTSDTFGFDYLQANLSSIADEILELKFDVALIDEIDSILLDSAKTPLVISGGQRVQSNYFNNTNKFVKLLKEGLHYRIDDKKKSIWLTFDGVKYAEKYFKINQLFLQEHVDLIKHIILALRANYLLRIEEDYIVDQKKVKLLDSTSGRIMEGSILEEGLHQAIEVKEGVSITDETRTLATITFQNLFKRFDKLTGMTGTAKTNQEEFYTLYRLKVIKIPVLKKNIRKDLGDTVVISLKDKYFAIEQRVKELVDLGRPVLIITESINSAEIYSRLFWEMNIEHSLLTASQNSREADIVAMAGIEGKVTIATIIAGRGTDIKVTDKVSNKGGLAVLAVEHFSTKRIDNQVKGRAARQGKQGSTEFYVSMEDKIFEDFPQKKLLRLRKYKHNKLNYLNKLYLRKLIDKIQTKNEEEGYQSRFFSLEMDETLKIQREMIYEYRNKVITSKNLITERLEKKLLKIIGELEDTNNFSEQELMFMYINDKFNTSNIINFENEIIQREEYLKELFKRNDELFRIYVSQTLIKAIDTEWIYHLDRMKKMEGIVNKRITIQKNPIMEYQLLGHELFLELISEIKKSFLKNFMLSRVTVSEELKIIFP